MSLHKIDVDRHEAQRYPGTPYKPGVSGEVPFSEASTFHISRCGSRSGNDGEPGGHLFALVALHQAAVGGAAGDVQV